MRLSETEDLVGTPPPGTARAFALIELLIAMGVLAVAIAALFSVIPATDRMNSVTNETEIACRAARAQMARLRARPLARGPMRSSHFEVDGLRPTAPDMKCGTLDIETEPFEGETVARATAAVRWLGVDGEERLFELSALVEPVAAQDADRADRGER